MDGKNINVCIPTYNRENMLARMLKSIDESISIVVSDNGGFVTKKMAGHYPNVLFKPSLQVLEMFTNWNEAILLSDAEYVVIPSDDDLYLENSFDAIISEINKSLDIDVLIFGHHVIDENDVIMSTWKPDRYECFEAPQGFKVFEYGVEARMLSIVFKRSFLDKIGLFDENFKLTAADSDLIQRALLLGNVKFIPTVISCYRIWNGGATARTLASKQWLDDIKYWTNKVSALAETQYSKQNMKFDSKTYSDEILAKNILAGAHILLSRGKTTDARNFILTAGIPAFCTISTKCNLYKALIASVLFKIKSKVRKLLKI